MIIIISLFNVPTTTMIYTISLHDALPIYSSSGRIPSEKGYRYYVDHVIAPTMREIEIDILKEMITDNIFEFEQDRKSTRLNSSHVAISYAVFCLKKKNRHTSI